MNHVGKGVFQTDRTGKSAQSAKTSKPRISFVLACSALAMMLAACGNDSNNDNKPGNNDDQVTAAPIVRDTNSTETCALDSDCVTGSFCFQNLCVVQCDPDNGLKCDTGYVCQTNRGRCVTQDFLSEVSAVHKEIEAAGDSMSSEEKANRLAALDLKARANSSVVYNVLGQKKDGGGTVDSISITRGVPSYTTMTDEQDSKTVGFATKESLGTVHYVVRSKNGGLPILKKAKVVTAKDGSISYQFEIEKKSLVNPTSRMLRDNTVKTLEPTSVEIVSSAGTFDTTVHNPVEATGYYEGTVAPTSILSGTPLPIRMMIETTPSNPENFGKITGMKLYLPVSGKDIFSPEASVDADGNSVDSWVVLDMPKKSNASDCKASKKSCFLAKFSTNDFASAGSKLFGRDSRVNRSLRIEFTDFDESRKQFTGVLVDDMTGLYRETSIESNTLKRKWNQTEMKGNLDVRMVGIFDKDEVKNAKPHSFQTEDKRSPDEAPVNICNIEHIRALYGKIVNQYKSVNCDEVYADNESEKEACNDYQEKIENCDPEIKEATYTALDDDSKWFCTQQAVKGVLSDDSRLSHILETVLTADLTHKPTEDPLLKVSCVKDEKPYEKEINNFKQFVEACADESCGICKDRPELLCGADLLGRRFLDNKITDTQEKADVMKQWLDMMRESYLFQEYLAWNNDTEIRREWLQGAAYTNTFASSIMDKFNSDLMERYNIEVLGAQHDVMRKQFTQTTLEMLAQTMLDKSNADLVALVTSNRNAILSELAQTWQSVAESLGLSARRHDVLTQHDTTRIAAAADLRAALFDLYVSGLIESKINLAAGQGSLNAGYGSNLNSTISKIESLDQPFESLVFMREGEIFKDTRLELNNTDTALGTLAKAATESVNNADARRKEIFDKLDAEALNQANINDSYKSALEDLRSQIVNLCGYPSDCKGKDRESCKILTEPYYCGFDIPSPIDSKVLVDLDKATFDDILQTKSAKATINCKEETIEDPVNPPNKITVLKDCGGGDLALESYKVNMADGANNSRAAVAILDFRTAREEYESAVAEYQIHLQKIENNYTTINTYASSVKDWYERRSQNIKKITDTIDEIVKYKNGLVDFDTEVYNAEKDSLTQKLNLEQQQFDKWRELSIKNNGVQIAMLSGVHELKIANIWNNFAYDQSARTSDHILLEGILGNTGKAAMGAGIKQASVALAESELAEATGTGFKIAAATMESSIELLEQTAEITNIELEYAQEYNDRSKAKEIDDLELKLKEQIATLTIKIDDVAYDDAQLKKMINNLEASKEELEKEYANKETYERDLQQVELLRNDFKNDALDLIKLEYAVKIKEIAVQRAYINYMTIAQEAQLLEGQYYNKMLRFKEISNIVFSASKFFQHASDLDLAEVYIESARNDLSNYLTAVEYLTVRPFVDLRRSIYTARGTNDLLKIKAQIDDLTENCGSGNESDHTVTISMRNRIKAPEDIANDLTPADRFHTILATGNLPIGAATRYSVEGDVGKILKDDASHKYYSGSFDLSASFANISGSCNAKIKDIRIRFVSKEGKLIRPDGDSAPTVTLFYGGVGKLLSCHSNIEAITASIGNRTSYGKYSTFVTDPFGDSINVSMYNVPEGTDYKLESMPDFSNVTVYGGLKGYPLMATYTILFDPQYGENSGIEWDNVADIEVQFSYTTGTLGQDSTKCKYDI